MSYIKTLILTIFLISLSLEGPCFITMNPKKYTDCRDKPADDGKYCCYLKMKSKDKRCVELTKDEVKDNHIKDTRKAIEDCSFKSWDNETEMADFKCGDVSEIRCTKAESLKNHLALFIALFAFLF